MIIKDKQKGSRRQDSGRWLIVESVANCDERGILLDFILY